MAHESVMAGDVLALEAYLSARGDPNAVSEKLQGRTLMHVAAYAGSVGAVEALLRYKSLDLNKKDRLGLSPLQCACTYYIPLLPLPPFPPASAPSHHP